MQQQIIYMTYLGLVILAGLIFTYKHSSIIQHQINVPKAHSFIKTSLKSSMSYATVGTATTGILTIIMQSTSYAIRTGVLLNSLYLTVGILTPYLIDVMEHMIRNIIEIYTRISIEYNGTGLSLDMLRQIHAYLTPYLRSYHSIFSLLRRIVGFFGESPELNQMQELYSRFLVACQNLMALYRQIEETLGITLDASPISIQVWGF